MKNSVSGTVVLYHPDDSVRKNIDSYINYVDRLYVVDNTENGPAGLVKELQLLSKVHITVFGKNIGVAAALNHAATRAWQDGYHWLLTMDQDTRAENDIVCHMLKGLSCYDEKTVGIFCARYMDNNPYVEYSGNQFNEMLVCISSGSLLNLNNHIKIGPFLDKLFIDQVDHELCLRFRTMQLKIIQANAALIHHRPGEVQSWAGYQVSTHNAVRKYFMTRNRLYVAFLYKKEFPKFFKIEIKGFLKEVIKILLVEKNKIKQVKALGLGVFDFMTNNFNRNVNDL